MGLIYSRAMANYFINQPNYYPETLYPLVTASIGGVKTIRTLRSDAPFTVSDMKSSYFARLGNLATGERLLRACLDGLRQTQYGLLYTPFLSGLAEVLAPAGRPYDSLAAADEALRRTERGDGFCWMPEALRVKGEAPLLSDKSGHDCSGGPFPPIPGSGASPESTPPVRSPRLGWTARICPMSIWVEGLTLG